WPPLPLIGGPRLDHRGREFLELEQHEGHERGIDGHPPSTRAALDRFAARRGPADVIQVVALAPEMPARGDVDVPGFPDGDRMRFRAGLAGLRSHFLLALQLARVHAAVHE